MKRCLAALRHEIFATISKRPPPFRRMPVTPSQNDPRPIPPVRPENDECCHSGCDPCIFDLYNEAMERYSEELEAWELRQSAGRR